MAIKPNDCIVPYGKLYHWEHVGDSSSWDSEQVWDVPYLENFNKHIYMLFKKVKHPSSETKQLIRDAELSKYGAKYKYNYKDSSKDYIKFKSHASLTMFILKFSQKPQNV